MAVNEKDSIGSAHERAVRGAGLGGVSTADRIVFINVKMYGKRVIRQTAFGCQFWIASRKPLASVTAARPSRSNLVERRFASVEIANHSVASDKHVGTPLRAESMGRVAIG